MRQKRTRYIRKFVRVSPEVKATIRKTWQEGKMATSRAYYSCATCGIRDHGNYAQIDVATLPDFLHDGTDVSGHYYAYLQLGHSWFVVNDHVVRPVSDNEVDIVCTGRHKVGITP